MTGMEVLTATAMLASVGLEIAGAAGLFSSKSSKAPQTAATYIKPPSLESDRAKLRRQEAINRSRSAFGLSRTKIADEDKTGLRLGQGAKVVGVPEAS